MQGDDPRHVKIAATCKHWYAYSLEDSDGKTRHDFDANVSARDLAETYLVPFQPCVAASVEQIMCSYNAVNQVPTWCVPFRAGLICFFVMARTFCHAIVTSHPDHFHTHICAA